MDGIDLFLGGLAVVAGAVAAIVGFGIGSLLTPALGAVIGTKAAVAVVAVPHLVATAVRLWALRRSVDRRVLLTFGLASAVGGLLGALLHAAITSPVLAAVLGLLLILAGGLELTGLGRRLRFPGPWAIAAGLASGAFGGLVGNQGGIRSAALLRFDLSPQALVATATASAILVDLARLPVYLVTSGAQLVASWPTILLLTAGVVLGTFVGAPILRRLPDPIFRRGLATVLILLGLALVAGLVV
ncbi:MAG TPA: sulfite exporter TauE/SafE family protein [candidate division Zixibacteria bacterium]|nr:sulfite exporter TauE/SafE family protein [candidate division Zixibacteria bacterium]